MISFKNRVEYVLLAVFAAMLSLPLYFVEAAREWWKDFVQVIYQDYPYEETDTRD